MTMYNDVIYLIKETRTVNEYGDMVVTESERAVFAQVKSIGQSEFYQAAAVGLKPEIKFVIADFYDYQGEKKLRYDPFTHEEPTPPTPPTPTPDPDPQEDQEDEVEEQAEESGNNDTQTTQTVADDPAPTPSVENVYSIIRTYRTGNALEIVCVRGVDE